MATELDMRQLKQTSNPRNVLDTFLRKLAGAEEKLTSAEKTKLLKCLLTNVIAFCCVLFGAVTAYYASRSGKSQKRYFTYMFFIIFPILVGVGLITQIFSPANKASTLLISGISLIGLILLSVYFLVYNTNNEFVNKVSKYVIILITVAILAIGYRIFIKYLKTLPGWLGFILKFLFYIPCLVLEVFEKMYAQTVALFSTTTTAPTTIPTNATKMVGGSGSRYDGVVFFTFLIIIGGGWAAHYLYTYFRNQTARSLVKRPLSLAKETTIATNDVMTVPTGYPKAGIIDPVLYSDSPDGGYNRNYSIDCWVSINTFSPNQVILKYGQQTDPDGTPILRGKPCIVTSDDEKRPFTLRFTNVYGNIEDAVFDFNMPLQKWNYLVVTYEDNRVSFYINGEAVFSRAITHNSAKIPSYDTGDVIMAGTDKGRLYGSICNVNYHTKPMTLRDITTTYKILKTKDIPTNYV